MFKPQPSTFLYLSLFLTLGILAVVPAMLAIQNRKQQEIEELRRTNGHLKSEIFQLENVVNRYEMTLEHFQEQDPKFASKFEDYMSQNTE